MCFWQFFSYWLLLPTKTAAQTYTLDAASMQRGRPRPSFLSYLAILPSPGATSLLLPPLASVGQRLRQWAFNVTVNPYTATNQPKLSHLVSYLHFVIRGQDCWWPIYWRSSGSVAVSGERAYGGQRVKGEAGPHCGMSHPVKRHESFSLTWNMDF